MSSSNNSNRKDDGSIITVDEFKSKVNQGKCFAGLAFSALLKADQELKENGEISSSTRNMLFMIQFNCLATSRALGLAAGDVELNSTGSSSVAKVLSNLAYQLDQYVQQIKIFLKANNMGHVPQEFSALLTAMASPTKEPGSPPSSIPMSVKRKRASKGIAGPALKRADDGDFTKSIQVYDSDGLTDDDDNNDDATVTTNNTSTVSTLTDSLKKSKKERPKLYCICGTEVAEYQLANHLGGSGLTSRRTGPNKYPIFVHSHNLMMLSFEKEEGSFSNLEQTCLIHIKTLVSRVVTNNKERNILVDKTVFLVKAGKIEGNHMINLIHRFLPEHWDTFYSILPPDSAAAKYAASLPQIAAFSSPSLDTKPAAAAATSSNAADGPPSPSRVTDAIPEADECKLKSLPPANDGKPAPLKSATSSSSGTAADKSIEDLQPPGEEELIPIESAISPSHTGTRHASTVVAAPNTPVGQTHNTVFNTSGPTVDAPRASHAQRRTSTTSASMPSTNGNVASSTVSNNNNDLSAEPRSSTMPVDAKNDSSGGITYDWTELHAELKSLAELRESVSKIQNVSLLSKIDKRIKILENELFPDL